MRLLNDNGKTMSCKSVEYKSISELSEDRLHILELLCKHPHYPAEIARELGLSVQTVYYQIRKLERAGFLEFVQYEERNGGVAKKYVGTGQSFAVIINNQEWKETNLQIIKIPALLKPFLTMDVFDGLIVLGSPDPHGKYRARASEFGVLELAMLIGRYSEPVFPLYSLDTQLKPQDRKKNLILAGGPKVNTLVAEWNDKLPIRFGQNYAEISSTLSNKKYGGNIGIVELIPNPEAGNKNVLVVSGLNQHGTRAAVISIIKKMNELEKGNMFEPKILAKIVEGFDEDGDGLVDTVEILE